MEHCAGRRAGVPKGDPGSGAGQRREAQKAAAGQGAAGLMDPRELLKLPLGVKVPVPPGSRAVFHRAKLREKLHQPTGCFDLGDPYSRRLGTEHNSLHDPYLQGDHSRKDNLQRLKREGFVTRDGKVGLEAVGLI
ncbi:fibrous sheath-interacting protein 2 [Apus apus]|uniref:fibrous sheath-interacting protein 2 n=1 Tax=Apus apus TaxID=8895 RepID=UPI0021F87A1A|nr:fibrous sheath-interacting protein 2 [Apus apus]